MEKYDPQIVLWAGLNACEALYAHLDAFQQKIHILNEQWIAGVLSPGVKSGRGVMLYTHSLLVPSLRKRRAIHLLSPQAPFIHVQQTTSLVR
jgi:hypothetical protein